MDWTKVKPKHFLYTDMSLGNIGCMTVLLCLTAHLERLPTEGERIHHTHIRALRSLDEVMKKRSCTVDEVLMKVLEDSEKVDRKKKQNATHQTTYREKHKKALMESKPLHKPLEERREEKRRGEETDSPFFKTEKEIEQLCQKSLSKIAPPKKVSEIQEMVKQNMRWVIHRFLKKTYPESYKQDPNFGVRWEN